MQNVSTLTRKRNFFLRNRTLSTDPFSSSYGFQVKRFAENRTDETASRKYSLDDDSFEPPQEKSQEICLVPIYY